MVDIQMNGFKEVMEKYPQHAERIAEAFNTVLAEPDRDLEAELYDCGIDEEDIFKLAESVIEAQLGGFSDGSVSDDLQVDNEPVKVTIWSWLNFDGFECNDKGYKLDELDKLGDAIGDRPIEWIRGKNTFAGEPVSDKFMVDMKTHLLTALGREDDGIDVTSIPYVESKKIVESEKIEGKSHKLPVKKHSKQRDDANVETKKGVQYSDPLMFPEFN